MVTSINLLLYSFFFFHSNIMEKKRFLQYIIRSSWQKAKEDISLERKLQLHRLHWHAHEELNLLAASASATPSAPVSPPSSPSPSVPAVLGASAASNAIAAAIAATAAATAAINAAINAAISVASASVA